MQTRFLISSVLVLALTVRSLAISWPLSHNHVVLDSEGNELQAGQPYYLVSAAQGGGGGGVALDRRQSSRPSTVKQHSSNTKLGTPVSFSPAISNSHEDMIIRKDSFFESAVETMIFGNTPLNPREKAIHEATDVNIRFSEMPVVWQVEESHHSPTKSHMRYVTIGGQPGHPGSSTVRNWFKIERISRSNLEYRIVYCPSVCESCPVECGNINIMEENEKRWLTVSQHKEFPFMFVKARHG